MAAVTITPYPAARICAEGSTTVVRTMRVSGESRSFLFLQGPHGPFFHRLGAMLRAAGCTVHRIGFNRGDQAFWPDRASYIPFKGRPEDWPATLERQIDALKVTDIVLYGDTRPIHAAAVAVGGRTAARGAGAGDHHGAGCHPCRRTDRQP